MALPWVDEWGQWVARKGFLVLFLFFLLLYQCILGNRKWVMFTFRIQFTWAIKKEQILKIAKGQFEVILQGWSRRNCLHLNSYFNWAVRFGLLRFCSKLKKKVCLFVSLERPCQWQLKNGEKEGPCLSSMCNH